MITILTLLVVVGCGKSEDENRRLTEEEKKVVGSYEAKDAGGTGKLVFHKNGKIEFYENDAKDSERKWRISGKEVHVISPSTGTIGVYRIETNGDLTIIARIIGGKREEAPKEFQ